MVFGIYYTNGGVISYLAFSFINGVRTLNWSTQRDIFFMEIPYAFSDPMYMDQIDADTRITISSRLTDNSTWGTAVQQVIYLRALAVPGGNAEQGQGAPYTLHDTDSTAISYMSGSDKWIIVNMSTAMDVDQSGTACAEVSITFRRVTV
jgi:hypothetical protein